MQAGTAGSMDSDIRLRESDRLGASNRAVPCGGTEAMNSIVRLRIAAHECLRLPTLTALYRVSLRQRLRYIRAQRCTVL